jgi:hypothetical protein
MNTICNYLSIEESYMISFDYFKIESNNIDITMRSKLTTWMLELCEEEECTNEIYSLSVNLFDRVMCVLNGKIDKYHLQLVGIVCLFIASKLNSNEHSLDSVKLIEYTDHAFTLEELIEWEVLILQSLKWDIASVCPNDYLEYFLAQHLNLTQEHLKILKKHSYAFTALCSTDYKFAFFPASMIASACFLTALDGLLSNTLTSLKNLAEMTQTDADFLQQVKDLVKDLFNKEFTSIGSKEALNNESELNIEDISFDQSFLEQMELKYSSPNDSFNSSINNHFFDSIMINSKRDNKIKKSISKQIKRRSSRQSGRIR